MDAPIVQIYEVQTPREAREMIDAGVHHVGSVVLAPDQRHDPLLRETVAEVRRRGAVSSLIPLFKDPARVLDCLADLRPHIVHFCDHLVDGDAVALESARDLQAAVRRHFPDMRIMRSIPIGQPGKADGRAVMALAAELAPTSDFFLTDTVLADAPGSGEGVQPVHGFVGITGRVCDWSVAAQLVASSRIPVILAGGIAPENVVAGLKQVRPYGVDSCTGTNAVDGEGRPIRFRKDIARVRQLVAAVRRVSTDNQGG